MKIAFFTDTWHPNVDGVVVAITSARKELERRGHEVFVLAAGTSRNERKDGDERVFTFRAVSFPPYPMYKLAIFPYSEAEEIVKSNDIDVIHSHGMGPMGVAALFVSAILDKPLIGTLHTNIQEATHYVTPIKPMQRVMKSVAWRYLKWYYNQCDSVVVPSEYMRKECKAHGIRNVITISNGIDLKRFRPGKKVLWKDRTVILYMGRIVREKNLDVVIKASNKVKKKIPNVLFVIVGGGPAEQYYKDSVKTHGVGDLFLFVGGVQPKDVLQYYHNADVFVFPSMFETQGLSGIEAMACGLPIAGADYLAIPNIVKTGSNGHLFKPHDTDGCANAILYCVRNRKRLGKNAIKSMQSHSIDKSVSRLLSLYAKLIVTPRQI